MIKTNKNGISIFFNIEIFKSLLNYKEFSDYVKQTIKTPVKTPVKTSVKTSVKKERTVAEIALKYNIVMTSSMEKLVRSLSQEKNIINSQMALRNAINSRLLTLSDQEKENVFKIISEKWNLPEIAEYLPKTKKNNIKVKKTYDELFHKYGISKSFNFDKFKRSVSSLKNGIDYNNLEQVLRDRAIKTSPEILEYLDANIEKFKSVFIEKFNLKPMTGGGSTDKYKYFTVPQNVKHNIEKGLRYAPKTGSNTKNARVLFEMEKIPSKFYYKMRKWFNENSSQEKDFKLWLKNKKTNKKKQITDWLLHGGLDGMKFFTTKK